ncbi:Transcriptional regulator, XRE family (modular protein) [Mesorhizobium plurifarium]|uniref:Transcriptional regulator, XRE family (Modular protein) n=1 Tax=Mesorhizobium plurifarium TaxID=69974 RepID=A0A090E4J9_MESPL|nr:Transcriptional regulator, XRE family (modular protein) [Mesorhizobium plurifarium]
MNQHVLYLFYALAAGVKGLVRMIIATLPILCDVALSMTISPAQCRAARALLHWSQRDLTERSGVAMRTIADFERSARTPFERTLRDIQEAFEAGGIMFLAGDNVAGEGVRRRHAALGE